MKSEPAIPAASLEAAARCLRVLAHPDRLRIVEQLDLHGKVRVGDLAVALDLAPNAVSQHLNQMRAHNLLHGRREGREVYYRVTNPHALNVLRCIREHGPGHSPGHSAAHHPPTSRTAPAPRSSKGARP